MQKNKNQDTILYVLGLCFLMLFPKTLESRSVHRPKDPLTPFITTRWLDDNRTYTLRGENLEEYPFFQIFNKDFFYKHYLPKNTITYRTSPQKTVAGATLTKLVNQLLQEIHQKKKSYTHFTVLRKSNFNLKKPCGLIVLKFNAYPFILKLFIETPETFIDPYCKGFVPSLFFHMAGGVNRHMTGFTRVKNAEIMKQRVQADPYWSTFIDTPRKWFLLPEKPTWIHITSTNIQETPCETSIPGTYCVIADAIESNKKSSLLDRDYRATALKLCNFLDHWIDPHIDNFMLEQATNKIVIVDTEHFPSVVGLKKKKTVQSYVAWYTELTRKCAKDMFFYTKKQRRNRRNMRSELSLY